MIGINSLLSTSIKWIRADISKKIKLDIPLMNNPEAYSSYSGFVSVRISSQTSLIYLVFH